MAGHSGQAVKYLDLEGCSLQTYNIILSSRYF